MNLVDKDTKVNISKLEKLVSAFKSYFRINYYSKRD